MYSNHSSLLKYFCSKECNVVYLSYMNKSISQLQKHTQLVLYTESSRSVSALATSYSSALVRILFTTLLLYQPIRRYVSAYYLAIKKAFSSTSSVLWCFVGFVHQQIDERWQEVELNLLPLPLSVVVGVDVNRPHQLHHINPFL